MSAKKARREKKSEAAASKPVSKSVSKPVSKPLGTPRLPVPKELACFLAWLVPGAGHLLLGRWQRGAGFLFLVMLSLVIGCQLEGNLPWTWSGSPLLVLATLGSLGAGLPSLVLNSVLSYQGNAEAPGFEYGSAFIITAGLMNLLLVLDVWDISLGTKE